MAHATCSVCLVGVLRERPSLSVRSCQSASFKSVVYGGFVICHVQAVAFLGPVPASEFRHFPSQEHVRRTSATQNKYGALPRGQVSNEI